MDRNRQQQTRARRCAFVGSVLLAAAVPAVVHAQDPDAARIDAVFAEYARPGSPGCVLGVMRDGRMIYENGYGYANLDWDVPITPETVFYVGSVSKQFTAAAVALLAREGRLSLDDDIRRHLPEMPAYERPVTVRHLIHHTSGVRDLYALMGLVGERVEDVFPDSAALALLVAQTELSFPPGDDYLYSNGGYFLLREIVQRVSGQSLREFTTARIFEPLGMTDTHFHDRPGHIVERRAMSYAPDDNGGFVQNYMSNFDKVGAGGLYSTVGDLLKWDGIFYEDLLGGPGFAESLLQRGVLTSGDTLAYAFALNVTRYKGLRMIAHAGSMMGFRADFIRFPDQHLSVATLCNLGSTNPSALARQVADLYLADDLRVSLAEYTGAYRNPEMDVKVNIDFHEGDLRVQRSNGPESALAGGAPDEFRAYGSWALDFQRDDARRITGFVLDVGRARRVQFVRESDTSLTTRGNDQ